MARANMICRQRASGRPPVFLPTLALAFLFGCVRPPDPADPAEVPIVRPRILESVPHDPAAFTQGLLIDGDVWLESTGLYGQSELREVERRTGRVLRRVRLAPDLFGEGLALWQGRLYQLTWREGVCLVYDRAAFKPAARFAYEGEGWGLASCERWLYMSNGSATVRVLDPTTFKEQRRFEVHGPDGPVGGLNEMARVGDELWANVFPTRLIARFRPEDGRVLGFLDLTLFPPPEDAHPDQDVLNGIAYDPANGGVWVTGKKWTRLYRIEWPPAR